MNKEKSAIITGGTSGLGYSSVFKFLEEGWNVATCGRRKAIIETLNSKGNEKLYAEICDISIESSIGLFVREVGQRFGKIDLLVLNAASLGPIPLPKISQLDPKDLRMIFETNFFGNFIFLKAVLPLMNRGGIIVHITSDASSIPYMGWAAYSSSKAAFEAIIRVLGIEMKEEGIKAINFDPGDIDTEMHHKAVPSDNSYLKKPMDAARELFSVVQKMSGEKYE